MEFIATTIDLQTDPVVKSIWSTIEANLAGLEGVCYYKSPQLNFMFEDIPEIVILSKEYGIFVVKLFLGVPKDIDGDSWVMDDGSIAYNPDLVINDYSVNIESRLVDEHLLRVSRNQSRCIVPIHEILVLPLVTETTDFKSKFSVNSEIVFSNYQDPVYWNVEYLNSIFSKHPDDIKAPYNTKKDEIWSTVVSKLEGTSTFKKKHRYQTIFAPKTKGDLLIKSKEIIFLLDKEQRQIAKQIPNGPQRVRGLAGTGKTVVLAIKAAILHAQFPDKKILFTFYTRSMYNQIINLIETFFQEEGSTEVPNWKNLHVRHSWGSAEQTGVYREICNAATVPFVTLSEATRQNYSDPFSYACNNVYSQIIEGNARLPKDYKYDLVLIDEAQDLPTEFFKLIYEITTDQKRIVWAYDEFQTLSERKMPGPTELFGTYEDGSPKVRLDGEDYPGKIKKDFVLHNSYRNPKIILMVAHALGMGIYKDNAMVRKISKEEWVDYGYEILRWDETVGKAAIRRDDLHSMNKLESFYSQFQLGDCRDLFKINKYDDNNEQIEKLAELIRIDITDHGMKPHDIIVIDLDTRNQKNNLLKLQRALSKVDIDSVLPGIIESPSTFLPVNKVTLTTVRRAKGNEAASIYIINSQIAFDGKGYNELITTLIMRNTLFTAITRAQGWCNVIGFGPGMDALESEVNQIKINYPTLELNRINEEDLMSKIGFSTKSEKELEEIDDLLRKIAKHKDLLEKLGLKIEQ